MSDAYKQGFLDGIAAYAWNKDGCLWVGTTGTTLKQAQQNVEKTWNYSPVPAGSPPENGRLDNLVHLLNAALDEAKRVRADATNDGVKNG